MKENCGNLNNLKQLEKLFDNSFSKEQLLNENLKNNEGESNIEVRKRMVSAINDVLENNYGKRVAIVSHGAAIKFYLQNFCKFDSSKDVFYFKGKEVGPLQIKSPSVLKLQFNDNDLMKIKVINI
ncbi:MAG: histidine phosphatase family protein [Clostridia bacterium]|nr:histidine phosphatase family protein [Clostridia bacterium]